MHEAFPVLVTSAHLPAASLVRLSTIRMQFILLGGLSERKHSSA